MSTPSFLQSPEWQDIQEQMGRRTIRISGALVVRHNLPLGFAYLYVPRPGGVSGDFFDALRAHARASGALFLKIDPSQPLPPRPAFAPGRSLQPRETVIVDCRADDAVLLAAMHPKTRYNIRLALRHGVRVRMAPHPVSPADCSAFWDLLAAAARRDGFYPHPRAHYRILLDERSADFSNELFIAELGGQPLAAAIVNCYTPSATATYLHGGSSRRHRAAMAPHLLHWRVMQEVRRRGLAWYDFGGVDDAHWPGLTRFKRGFGGRPHAFPPSVDFPFRALGYRLYRLQHSFRRLL